MRELSHQLTIPIDTLGRYYNVSKNKIVLPEDDEDEIYAGDYFPRRFPSDYLSLEYLTFYTERAKENTIALVVGVYDDIASADSAFAVLKQTDKKAFQLTSEIYIGCMH